MRTLVLCLLLLAGAVAWAATPDPFGNYDPMNGVSLVVHLREATQESVWDSCVAADGSCCVVLGGGVPVELPRDRIAPERLDKLMAEAAKLGFFSLPARPSGKFETRYLVTLQLVHGDQSNTVVGYPVTDPVVGRLRAEVSKLIPAPPVPDRG
ncbi:MAG TPA: hypothetical protein VGO93_12970 [Candidatus Xenobia bacterium]|jgi:hypothetical protein